MPVGAKLRGGLAVILPLLLAVALVTADIGSKSLWLDEAFSVVLVKLGWTHMGQILMAEQANMSGYHVVLYGWVRLFGTSESAVRALSAVFAILCIPTIYILGCRIYGRRHGVIASVLLAINGFYIQYAQEARGYAMVLLLSALSSYFFISAVRQSSLRTWIAYVATSAAGLYAHVFATLVILAHCVFLLRLRWRSRAPIGSAALSLAGIAVLAMPLALFMSRQGHLEWLAAPTIWTVLDAVEKLSGNGGRGLVALYLVLCSSALLGAFRCDSRSWAIELLLIWLVLPFIVTVPFSLAVKPIFQERFLIICLPPLVLLAAAGLAGIRSRVVQVVAMVLMCALAARSLFGWYFRSPKEAWRAATEYVLTEAQAGDGIVFDPPYARLPVEYYVRRDGAEQRAPQPTFPTADWGELDPITPEFSESTEAVLPALRPFPPRLWLVSRGRRDAPVAVERFRQIGELSLTGVTIRLYATRAR